MVQRQGFANVHFILNEVTWCHGAIEASLASHAHSVVIWKTCKHVQMYIHKSVFLIGSIQNFQAFEGFRFCWTAVQTYIFNSKKHMQILFKGLLVSLLPHLLPFAESMQLKCWRNLWQWSSLCKSSTRPWKKQASDRLLCESGLPFLH